MAAIIADRVRDTSTTTGTGAVAVSGTAPTGYRTFSTVCTSPSDTIRIMIHNQAVPSEWEVSNATYSAANTLTRTTVEASSNAGAAVSFSAGTKDVVHVQSATQIAGAAGGTPGGSNTQMQYNNSAAFGGANLIVDSANQISQRNSTNECDFRVYQTYTDASNGMWLETNWSGGTMYFRTIGNGTGAGAGPIIMSTGGSQNITISAGGFVTLGATGGVQGYGIASDGILPLTADNALNLGRASNRFQIAYLGTTTVSGLPAASGSNRGARTMVTDANAATFGTTAAGGGSNVVPVFSDGTVWKIG